MAATREELPLETSSVTIPLMTMKRLGPAAVMFVLYNLASGAIGSAAELTSLVAGLACGLVLARGAGEAMPPVRRVAATMAAIVVVAVVSAVRLRGVTDARPEIARVVAVEDRTAAEYKAAADRVRNGRMTGEALAQLIDRTILPELQATDARLKALERVPQEQQALVADAGEYVRLRSESWRLRAQGLRQTSRPLRDPKRTELASDARVRAETRHRANLLTLGKAEGTERDSLKALQRIKEPASQ